MRREKEGKRPKARMRLSRKGKVGTQPSQGKGKGEYQDLGTGKRHEEKTNHDMYYLRLPLTAFDGYARAERSPRKVGFPDLALFIAFGADGGGTGARRPKGKG